MEAKNYFERLIYADQQINADLDELERLRSLMSSISAPDWSKGVPASGGTGSKVENIAVKFIDLERKITEEIDELVDLKDEARKLLQDIDPQQRVVLQEYYINRKSISAIASRLYINYRRVQEIKAKGLEAMQPVIDNKETILQRENA